MRGKKIRKFVRNPGIFLRDYFLKRYPFRFNEIGCSQDEVAVLIKHDLDLGQLAGSNLAIDVVYTWVDGGDEAWLGRYANARKVVDQECIAQYADDRARFESHDELRYSLLSVKLFMPWVRRIYIVTDRQRPEWLLPDEQIQIIDHAEIIDSRYLPTFNSHVIEAHLHRIPGLGEHFIYFNDDVFAARALPAEHFFRGNGISSLFLSNKSLKGMRKNGNKTPTQLASERCSSLLRDSYGQEIDRPLVHTYIPLRKSMFELAWSRHETHIRGFLGNRFRGNNDLNMASFLVPWMSYFEGLSVPARDICYYFNLRSPFADFYMELLQTTSTAGRPHSFCANDFHSLHGIGTQYSEKLTGLLESYFGVVEQA